MSFYIEMYIISEKIGNNVPRREPTGPGKQSDKFQMGYAVQRAEKGCTKLFRQSFTILTREWG